MIKKQKKSTQMQFGDKVIIVIVNTDNFAIAFVCTEINKYGT